MFLSLLNSTLAFFNLITEVSETSALTYILAFFLIDITNFTSTVHDNLSFNKFKASLTTFTTLSVLTQYLSLQTPK